MSHICVLKAVAVRCPRSASAAFAQTLWRSEDALLGVGHLSLLSSRPLRRRMDESGLDMARGGKSLGRLCKFVEVDFARLHAIRVLKV